jgi:hypothetical protein
VDPPTGNNDDAPPPVNNGNSGDAGAADAASTGSDGGGVDDDAGAGEFIEGTFGGVKLTLTAASSGIDPNNGNIQISATPTTAAQYPRISVSFVPAAGTTACAAGLPPQVDYIPSATESYYSFGYIPGSTCSITVTQLGPRGAPISGTFIATMKQYLDGGGVTIQAEGAFNVVRQE